MNIKEEKQRLRSRAKEKRSRLDPVRKQTVEGKIVRSFLSLSCLARAKTLLVFFPQAGEFDLRPLIDACREKGLSIAYPRCGEEKGEMEFYLVSSENDLLPGRFGILEPKADCPSYDPSEGKDDICIVPGLLYDKSGTRLGYGGGYYDRYLTRFPGLRVGLSMQIFVSPTPLPKGRFDLPVHILVTEKEVTHIHAH